MTVSVQTGWNKLRLCLKGPWNYAYFKYGYTVLVAIKEV